MMRWLFFVLIIVAGCKKNIYSPLGSKLKSIDVSIYTYGATVPSKSGDGFTYNSEGQLIAEQDYNPQDTSSSIIVYGLNTVTYKTTSLNGTQQPDIVYTLNSQGYGISTSTGSKYAYDSSGYLISDMQLVNADTTTDTCTYADGNQITDLFCSGTPSVSTITYTYLTDKLESRNFPPGIFGRNNKNLVGSNYQTTTSGPIATVYTYQYDNIGRVIQETQNASSPPGSPPYFKQVSVYTYY